MSYLTNQVAIQGTLIKKEVSQGTNKNGSDYLGIELTIRTGENEEHIVRMYSNRLTKNGQVSKIYESMETVAKEYLSADMQGVGIENADKVSIRNGEISINRYMDKMGELRESRRLTTKFCSRVEGEIEGKSEFALAGVVESVVPKMNMEDEVELLKLTLIVPKGYNNLIDKVEVVVRDTSFFDYIEENFTKGVVVRVGGKVVNRVEKTVQEVPATGFGQMPQLSEKTVRVSELLAEGGMILYGAEETEFFTEEEITKGLELFNQQIEELKSTKVDTTPFVPQGFGGNPAPTPFGNPYVQNTPTMPNF